VHADNQNESVAVTDLGFRPLREDAAPNLGHSSLAASVGGASLKLNRQNYSRDEIKVTAAHPSISAAHHIK
jgi:hypothetical protein